MKNYELIAELLKYPAGCEVTFDCLCETYEVDVINDSDDGDTYYVKNEICSVDEQDGRIMLS